MKPHNNYYKHQKFFVLLDKIKIKPWHWLSLSVMVAGADFISSPDIHFSILYILPVTLAGWYGNRNHALILAFVLPCLRFIFYMMWDVPWLVTDTVINILIRIVVFTTLAYLVSYVKELHFLIGFLSICSYCGHIKDDDGSWIPLQEYIFKHSEAMLSHGICEDCVQKLIANKNTLNKIF